MANAIENMFDDNDFKKSAADVIAANPEFKTIDSSNLEKFAVALHDELVAKGFKMTPRDISIIRIKLGITDAEGCSSVRQDTKDTCGEMDWLDVVKMGLIYAGIACVTAGAVYCTVRLLVKLFGDDVQQPQ